MARLVVMLATFSVMFVVYGLIKNKNLSINTELFDFDAYQKLQDVKSDLILQLEKENFERAHAGEKIEVAAPEIKIVLETAEEKNGQVTYDKRCLVCHGKMGEGKKSQNAAKIGGQYSWYIYAQLTAIKNKTRINKVMDPYLKPLDDKDLKELSAYIAKLPW